MTFWQPSDWPIAMASRWRRKRVCELIAEGQVRKVALRDISGSGARLDTRHAPTLGSRVELRHPYAGSITGMVCAIGKDEVRISFDERESAVAFALGAIAADMTRD